MNRSPSLATLPMILASAALVMVLGCASTAYLDLDSQPSGAEIKTSEGTRVGVTPVTLRLGPIPSAALKTPAGWTPGKTFIASKEGYEASSWTPLLDMDGLSTAFGLPHTWNHVFILSPQPAKPVALPPRPAPPAPPPSKPAQPAPAQPTPPAAGAGATASWVNGKGTLSVTADRDDAEIYVDGQFVGNSPATLKLLEGVHVVEVKRDGAQTYHKEVHVTAESGLTLRVLLTP